MTESSSFATAPSRVGKRPPAGTQYEAGSGLGLSLVREFVAQMQGTVTIGSEVDKGTSITIGLPRHS